MARLRELRLAAEAKAAGEPKAKRWFRTMETLVPARDGRDT